MLTLPPAQALRTKRLRLRQAATRALIVCFVGTPLTGGVLIQCTAGAPDSPPVITSLVGSGFAKLDVPSGVRRLPHGYLRVRGSQIVDLSGDS